MNEDRVREQNRELLALVSDLQRVAGELIERYPQHSVNPLRDLHERAIGASLCSREEELRRLGATLPPPAAD